MDSFCHPGSHSHDLIQVFVAIDPLHAEAPEVMVRVTLVIFRSP